VKKAKVKKAIKNEPGFIPHLEELRLRILFVLAFFAAAFVAVFYFSPKLTALLRDAAGNPGVTLAYFKPYEKFMAYMKIAFFGALFIAVPYALVQAALFIRPALKEKEKKAFYIISAAAPFVFALGCAFGLFVVTPAAFNFFTGFMKGDNVQALWGMDAFYGFIAGLSVITGAVFVMPLPAAFLVRTGIISPVMITKARPYLIIGCFILAAFMTPGPDPVTQVLIALPLYALFEASVLIGKIK